MLHVISFILDLHNMYLISITDVNAPEAGDRTSQKVFMLFFPGYISANFNIDNCFSGKNDQPSPPVVPIIHCTLTKGKYVNSASTTPTGL